MKRSIISFINRKLSLVVIVVFLVFYLYFRNGNVYVPAEQLNIPTGIGVDIIEGEKDNVEYVIPISFYNFAEEEKITSFILTGKGSNIPETRESRQLLSNKKVLLGLEKAVFISEKFSKYGIRELVDIMFKNELVNDNSFMIVNKGKAEDILAFKIEGFPSSTDYIEGMILNSVEGNFFSDSYKFLDIFLTLDAEGKSLALPYIEIVEDKIEITGMALFTEDKMVEKIDIDKARVMNLLREDDVRGTLVLKEQDKHIGYTALSKRKVKCEKKGDKYTFTIDLSLVGGIVDNNLYPDISNNRNTMNKFERKMKDYIKEIISEFIKEMQEEYRIDCLSLGQVAAATYGRGKGIDWNKVVTESEIVVNIEVKVDGMGRGDY